MWTRTVGRPPGTAAGQGGTATRRHVCALAAAVSPAPPSAVRSPAAGCTLWRGPDIHPSPHQQRRLSVALRCAGTIDAKELHIGLLLLYDKLNAVSNSGCP